MQWFRSHHGAPFDTKLALVAKRANVTRGHAASVWWAVLDHASQSEERGSVAGVDPEEIAAAFDYDEDDVARVLDAMRHKSLLIDDDGMLVGWSKTQRASDANPRPSADEWYALRSAVFERDDYTCQYCGQRGGRLECDHIVPVALGGSSELKNLTTACFDCNRSKRDKTLEEWKACGSYPHH